MKSIADQFYSDLAAMRSPRVIEIGTRGWDAQPPKHQRDRVLATNAAATWAGVDAQAGAGVDVVADVHELGKHFSHGSFDAMICVSTLEHFRRPWIAVREMAKVMKAGGLCLISTHQAFPIHGYPSDYFRFTREAIAELFAVDAGWEIVESAYSCPCKVVPLTNEVYDLGWNFLADAWLNVDAIARRLPLTSRA